MITRMGFRLLLAAVVAGCASANSRFYTLNSTAVADGAPAVAWGVTVGPVTMPASVDRPQFVVQASPNRLQLDEFNRWAAPLDDTIARATAGNLEVLLGTPRVVAGSIANFAPTYRVTIDVQQFESIPGQSVLLDAVWAVHRTSGGEPRTGRTVAREAVSEKGYDALAAAHSRALATVSADIAAALRAQAAAERR
jgi:uncharacterized protein